jgi:hypothetical protein
LVYAPASGEIEKLCARIGSAFPNARLRAFTQHSDFASRLIHPEERASAAVVALSEARQALNPIAIRDLMPDTALIVALPDDGLDRIRRAHSLRPQPIGFLDSEYSELVPVIGRMIDIYRERGRTP